MKKSTTIPEFLIAHVRELSLAFILGLLFLFFTSCDKQNIGPKEAKLKLNVAHHFDDQSVELAPVQYINENGDTITVNDVKYFISGISFTTADGDVFRDLDIHYIDIKQPLSYQLIIDSIPPGFYKKMNFSLGIDEARNISNALPNTMNNVNMAWPDLMGGGYHFLKFEGQFLIDGQFYGYAFHLGKNKHRIDYELNLNKNFKYWNEELFLYHDLSEWFKSPVLYDFEIHEPYSMDNDSVMGVVKLNGSDAFSL